MADLSDKFMNQAKPHELFAEWLKQAQASELNDPNALALATCDKNGRISQRMVLLKAHEAKGQNEGFVFYTNLESDKAIALKQNSTAAMLFHWKSLNRQIRIEGQVKLVEEDEADNYFASRNKNSRIGAIISQQSRPLASKTILQEQIAKAEKKYEVEPISRPPYWSGFRLYPTRMEFWQEGDFRLHDRFIFTRDKHNWLCQRLYP